jgi:hypothetical protein
MALQHTTALNLIGKYVSFYVQNQHTRSDFEGVVSSLVLQLDGSHHLKIGFDDYYKLSDIEGLKVLGEIHLYPNE